MPDTIGSEITDVPDWFKPSTEFLIFREKEDPYSSRYYFNLNKTGYLYSKHSFSKTLADAIKVYEVRYNI